MARLENGPECLVTRTRSRVRSGPDMVRREPGPPGPAEFPSGASRREPTPKCYRSIPAPGDPPRPGLSSRPAIRVEPDPGTTICSPSADRPARSCAMARSATPPELRPLRPDKPIPQQARSASRPATAMRASYHSSSFPLLVLAFAAGTSPIAAIRAVPGPTRSGKPTDQASLGSPKTGPERPAAPRNRPAPRQPQPRRGPACSTPPPPRTSRDGAPSLVPSPRQAQARSPVRTVSRDSSISLERFLGHACPSWSLPLLRVLPRMSRLAGPAQGAGPLV